jgi:hypothetical protein
MPFHRDLADTEFRGNLLVEQSGHHRRHDFRAWHPSLMFVAAAGKGAA